MIKLKEVIRQLNNNKYQEIENKLIENKSDKLLFLLRTYKEDILTESAIMKKARISSQSFYVLKSRLNDRIKESLSPNLYEDREKTFKLILQLPDLCYNSPRETTITYLLKLEKELLKHDMNNELLIVYNTLKKIHLNSNKYFHYSQLYNKQISFNLSIEKAEEILGNFCRVLQQFEFSKSEKFIEQLEFLKLEINNINQIYNSIQIQLINNFIELHFQILITKNRSLALNTEELLYQTRKIFKDLPHIVNYKKWEIVLDYLSFEYYYSVSSIRKAHHYYEKVNLNASNFYLYNHIGSVSNFLFSKIKFCLELNKLDEISKPISIKEIFFDSFDQYLIIRLAFYNALTYFFNHEPKKAREELNIVLNNHVFVNYTHEFLNIKLTLAYICIEANELDEASKAIKAISRKIKSLGNNKYNHVFHLLKVFELEINKKHSYTINSKLKDSLILFLALNENKNNLQITSHLMPHLKNKFQI